MCSPDLLPHSVTRVGESQAVGGRGRVKEEEGGSGGGGGGSGGGEGRKRVAADKIFLSTAILNPRSLGHSS